MAKQTLQTIKSWFTRGAKPTQQQFSDVFDSYVHKDETIPQEKVEHLGETLNQLQESVTTALENSIGNVTVNGTPVKKTDKSVNIVIPQPDWSQNDDSAADFIKNRTHWVESVENKDYIVENVSLATGRSHSVDIDVLSGDYYVVIDGGTPQKFNITTQVIGGRHYQWIGTLQQLGLGGQPDIPTQYWCMQGIEETMSTFGCTLFNRTGASHTFTIYKKTDDVEFHKLDEKFIPETIARKTEVPDASAMIANHNVSEDAHYDIRQMALGASRAASFIDIQALVTALNTASVEVYRVGDNLYIDTINVADLWIAAVDSNNVQYSYTSDEDFDVAVSAGRVQIGYYFVSRLESGKVNIDVATRTSNGMMSSHDKTKLDGIVHGATKMNRGSGFTKKSGWCMGALNLWIEPHEAGYYSSPDDIIQIYAPDVKVTNGTISANEDGVIDLSAAVAGEIAAAVGTLEGTLRGDYNSLIGNLSSSISNALNGISSELAQCKRNAPEISQSTTLVAGGFNDLGVLTGDVTLSLPAITAGTAPEFNGQFTVDANGDYSVTFPNGVTMVGATTQEAGETYQFSICNGYGVIVKMA